MRCVHSGARVDPYAQGIPYRRRRITDAVVTATIFIRACSFFMGDRRRKVTAVIIFALLRRPRFIVSLIFAVEYVCVTLTRPARSQVAGHDGVASEERLQSALDVAGDLIYEHGNFKTDMKAHYIYTTTKVWQFYNQKMSDPGNNAEVVMPSSSSSSSSPSLCWPANAGLGLFTSYPLT